MSFNESKAGINAVISSADANSAFDVITTFFNFGYAKGYRAAMAGNEERRCGMTELDLFHQYIPDIAEMIINQRERTQEQRVQWYKDCVEYAKSLNPFCIWFYS